MRFDMHSSGTDDLCEKANTHQNRIKSKGAKSFRRILGGARMARLSSLAAFALGMAGSLFPEAAHAQEYPWCVSRESYLDCAYTTHEQCQWTASGIGGCAVNPRLLFPNTPGHPEAKSKNRPKDLSSRMY
jgi:Protein of unknown function (DUF3551)